MSPAPTKSPAVWLRYVGSVTAAGILLIGMVLKWGTLASTSAARLAVLRTVEPYALAVHEQLVRNRALQGAWTQTIHSGYDDAWTWSGHRALTLVYSSWLYPLAPSALGLTLIQITASVLGTIPAALIGRSLFRDGPLGASGGLLIGGGLYLLSPAIIALALQDYQDLCFAVPFLVFTLWTMRAAHPLWPLIGAAVGVMPREECVPLVLACAIVTLPSQGRRRHAWNIGASTLVVGAYAAVTQLLYPIKVSPGANDGHDTPLVNAIKTVFETRSLDDLPGLVYLGEFYTLVFVPLGLLALASPLTLLPALALLLMHMTVPEGYGVDRTWVGHAHHIAPVMPFVLVATIEGLARVVRLLARFRPRGKAVGSLLAVLGAGGALLFAASQTWDWGRAYHLAWSWTPWTPPYEHPAWTLARRLPPDAVPIVSVRHAVIASDRALSYTWEESLHDKARGQGLAAGTHMIVHSGVTEAVNWAMAMEGARVVDEAERYLTITWDAGAADPTRLPLGEPWLMAPDWIPNGYRMDGIPGLPPR